MKNESRPAWVKTYKVLLCGPTLSCPRKLPRNLDKNRLSKTNCGVILAWFVFSNMTAIHLSTDCYQFLQAHATICERKWTRGFCFVVCCRCMCWSIVRWSRVTQKLRYSLFSFYTTSTGALRGAPSEVGLCCLKGPELQDLKSNYSGPLSLLYSLFSSCLCELHGWFHQGAKLLLHVLSVYFWGSF